MWLPQASQSPDIEHRKPKGKERLYKVLNTALPIVALVFGGKKNILNIFKSYQFAPLPHCCHCETK